VGGKQCITTLDGYIIPFTIKDGLPYMEMTYPTDEDLLKYPHVVLTSDMDWDPSCLDCDGDDIDVFEDDTDDYDDNRIDSIGNYTGRVVNMLKNIWSTFNSVSPQYEDDDDYINYGSHIFEPRHVFPLRRSKRLAHQQLPTKATLPDSFSSTHDLPFSLEELGLTGGPTKVFQEEATVEKLEELQPKLGFAPLSIIKQTLKNTTRFYQNSGDGTQRTPMRNHFKSRFPTFNVKRRHEPVATDWIYSNTPAIDDGSLGAQIFIGCESLVADAFGAKTDKQFVNHLEDVIRK
jgi:hypothetical protein